MTLGAERNRAVEATLEHAFHEDGWRVQLGRGGSDFLVERGPDRYVVELRVARDARAAQLQALLADAFVRARRAAQRLGGVLPLAIVGAPVLSDRTARQLDEYGRTFLDGAPYGFVDAHGRVELRGPRLEAVGTAPGEALRLRHVRPPVAFDPFSDLNQWMLKVLLADRLPRDLLSAPRERVRNARQLAVVADVSVPSASRFVGHMNREGWLAQDGRHLELLRIEELLGRWQVANTRPAHELRAKWLLPSSNPRAQLDRALLRLRERSGTGAPRACLAMFSAAERLGYAHARGVLQHVYCDGGFEELLDVLEAVPSKDNEGADLALRRPAFRESVFRGAVERDGVPTADVLQVWLDVTSHPARGREQAEHIWRRVIVPSVLRRSQK